MSNPWSAIMPGGVAFTPRPDDDDSDWGFGAPGDPVGEAGEPTHPTQAPYPEAEAVSTDVDTPTASGEHNQVPSSPVRAHPLPAVPVPPADEAPAFAGWGDWDDDDETPAPAPVLAPGQWGTTPATETPAPAPTETPVVDEPIPAPPVQVAPAAPSLPPVVTTPVSETPSPAAPGQPGQWATPSATPAPAPVETPVVTAPVVVAPPVQVTPPAPRAEAVTGEPEQAVVHEGYRVNTTTGELTPAPATPAAPTPGGGAVVPVPPAEEQAPVMAPGQWGTPTPVTPAPVAPAPVTTAPVALTPVTTAPVAPVIDESPQPSGRTVDPVEELLDTEDDWTAQEKAEAAAEAAAKAAKDKERISRMNRPVAVTARDIAILQFLARYRMATYPQLSSTFGISYDALRQRMPKLAKEGLVVKKAVGKSSYSVWLPTDAGMKVAGMDLSLPTLSWATVAHTLGLVDVGIRFEALNEVVVTEREIRAADTRDQPTDRMRDAAEITGFSDDTARLYVVDMGDGSRQYAHIPDMVLARRPGDDGSARSVAIELELSHKPAAQWKKILTAYLNAPHIGQVIYYTHQSKVRSGILAAAKEVGAEHMVRVRKFEPSEENVVPLPGK